VNTATGSRVPGERGRGGGGGEEEVPGMTVCFPFTTISVFDRSRRKFLYARVIKSMKQYILRGCNVRITGGRDL
jgi:hypothetical protein